MSRLKKALLPRLQTILSSVTLFVPLALCSLDPYQIKSCGKLFTEDGFKGVELSMMDQDHSLNLAENHQVAFGWNETGSIRIENGCKMNLCNETYFDGNCKTLQQGTYGSKKLSSDLGFAIASAGCACKTECKCSDIFMKRSSYARAYLEGGCNTCNSLYTDLANSSDSFPLEFEGKVKAFRLRKGCTLTLYSEEDLDGDTDIIADETVENYNGSFKSYEIECDDSKFVARATKPRPPHFPPLVKVPKNVKEVMKMLRDPKHANHAGLRAALASRSKERSLKNAYILLLGTTGSGKSSTINLLFDNQPITKTGDYVSTTSDIHEFRISIPIDELGLTNTELRVIDTPGLGDTRGVGQDAKFLATLDNFLSTHEELKDTIPNAVLIFHKFNDNRFNGIGSPYVKMIKGFDAFRKRITDENYSNVIHVLTHFCGESTSTKRRPGKRLQMFKSVIEDYSLLPRPTLIALAENKGAENSVPMVNGYFKLPNNEYFPRNLFEKLELITQNGEDPIGLAVFRTAFRNSDNFKVSGTTYKLVDGDGEKVQRYLRILSNANYGVVKTQISDRLAQVWDNHVSSDLKKRYPESLPYLQKSLHMLHINTAEDVPKTVTEIVKLLTAIKHDPATRLLMDKALGIKPPQFPTNTIAGNCYNLFKDAPLPISPFESGEYQQTDIGFTIPTFLTCKLEQSSTQNFDIIEDKAKYIQHRFRSLGIEGQIAPDSFKGVIKPGQNIKSIAFTNGSSSLSASREFKHFQFILHERPTLKKEFTEIVKSLPKFNQSSHESVTKWNEFFNTYGTHVVKSIHGGGAIEIQIRNKGPPNLSMGQALFDLVKFAEDMSFLIGNDTSSRTVLKEGVDHTLVFSGGSPQYHTRDFTKLSIEDAVAVMKNWKKSLKFEPALLTTEMQLMPISQVAKKIGPNFEQEIERVSTILFNSTLIYVPIQAQSNARIAAATGGDSTTGEKNSSPSLERDRTPFMGQFFEQMNKANARIQEMMLGFKKTEMENAERQRKVDAEKLAWEKEKTLMEHNLKLKEIAARMLADEQRRKAEEDMMQARQNMFQQNEQKQQQWMQAMMASQQAEAARSMDLAKAIIMKPPPPRGGSCLKEGTKILMFDGTKKSVETLQVGDIVVDKDMKPTTVLGVAHEFLLDQTFYGFDNNSFFFTNSHLFVGPNDEGTSNSGDFNLYAKSTENLFHNNPLIEYLNVRDMSETKTFKLFHVNENSLETMSISVKDVVVTKDSQTYPSDTPIYFIQVDSPTGTYFANGYVCRHEIPPVEHWPNTMSILFRLMETKAFEKLADLPYTFETVSYLQNANKEVAELVERFLESKEGKWNSTEGERKHEVMTLSDVNMGECIGKIFSDPTLSTAGVNFYAQVGRVIAKYLDNPELEDRLDPVSLGKIQYELYQILHQEMVKFTKENYNKPILIL